MLVGSRGDGSWSDLAWGLPFRGREFFLGCWFCCLLLDAFAELFASSMEMGADSVDGEREVEGNLFVSAFFLMIEHQDGAFDGVEQLELVIHKLLKLTLGEVLLGVGRWVREAVFPAGVVIGVRCGDGNERAVDTAAALPFVLGNVDGDAVEISREHGVAAEGRESAVEAEEDFLGEIFDMLAAAGETREGTEDHCLVVAHDLLEGDAGLQVG